MNFKKNAFSVFNSRMFAYRFFKLFPQWKEYDTGKMKDLTNIIKEFHSDMIDLVCTERAGVDLPQQMGRLMIVSYKSNRMYPDFRRYKSGVTMSHTNNHTDGLKCKIFYTNIERRYKFKDKHLWEFVAEAPFKQEASKAFRANHIAFSHSPDRMVSVNNKKEFEFNERKRVRIEKFMSTYNEFDLN